MPNHNTLKPVPFAIHLLPLRSCAGPRLGQGSTLPDGILPGGGSYRPDGGQAAFVR